MEIEESGIKFEFPNGNTTVKFDDDKYYRKFFCKVDGAKGVDFISSSEMQLLFVEVKNCAGHESECTWRIFPNKKKLSTTHTTVDTKNRESLDIEVAQKVAMSIACIVGAHTYLDRRETGKDIVSFGEQILSEKFALDKKSWYVILFLEGDFSCESRSKKMIMQELQQSLSNKLSWLNCRVSVVDSHTYPRKLFMVNVP